jgi:hypothetical protein
LMSLPVAWSLSDPLRRSFNGEGRGREHLKIRVVRAVFS